MNCPECGSDHIRKNGIKRGKQNHICCNCRRQFIQDYEPSKTYSNEIKEECIRMYLNGMVFRAIERVKGVLHTTIITWVKQLGQNLADAPPIEEIPEVGELDELETFVGSKSEKLSQCVGRVSRLEATGVACGGSPRPCKLFKTKHSLAMDSSKSF